MKNFYIDSTNKLGRLVSPKKLLPMGLLLAFIIGFLTPSSAFAATPSNDTLPTVSVSGTTISVTHATWSETGFSVIRKTSGTYSTGASPREFHDYVVACTSQPTEYRTPTTVNPLLGFGCDAVYNANTGGLPPTDTAAAYYGSSGSRTLLDLSNRYIAILSIYGFDGSTFYRVLTLSNSSPSSSNSDGSTHFQSSKIPAINEFVAGVFMVSSGQPAKLTGARLNCTTSVSVNDKPSAFSYQTLNGGEGQISIAIPSDLAPGKHRLSMDSCGGNVVYENILMVSKPEAKLNLTMTTGIERGLALVKLRAFVRENRADYNTVECVADAANPTQKKHATQLVDSFCKRAFSLLESPKEQSTLLKSDNQQNSIRLTVTLRNR